MIIIISNAMFFALIFIIFYGGFGTKISTARGTIINLFSFINSRVFLTALLTAVFAKYFLNFSWQLSLLIGAVISSTDASLRIFNFLRTHKLNFEI